MMNPIAPPVGAAGGSKRQPRRRMILLMLLLCTWLFNAWPFAGATVFAQATETVIDSTEERFTVPLDQPFALRVEQTAEIAGEDLIVELLYLDETSGCTDASCTELSVSAALYTKAGDQQISNSFSTTFAPDKPYVVEAEGYDLWVLNVTTADDDSPVLVLQVVRNATAATDTTSHADYAPLYVDECANFSPFDAAAILQAPVNDGEPVGNLIFGPLSDTFDSSQGEMQGFCGYTGAESVEADAINQEQPHLLTDLPYADAVAVAHITTAEIAESNDVLLARWYDLFALVDVLGAADPTYDSGAMMADLGEFGPDAPFLEALKVVAEAAPNTTVYHLSVAADSAYSDQLWIWQPLDDGYFALLVARTENSYDLVVARLGSQGNEQAVQGYAQVILAQLDSGAATAAEPPSAAPTSFGCEQLSVDDAALVVGAPVVGQTVTGEDGVGCRFEADAEEGSIDPTLFSSDFATYGLLAGRLTAEASPDWLATIVEELADTSDAVDEQVVADLLTLIDSADYNQAVGQIAAIDWQSSDWVVEPLTALDAETLLLYYDLDDGGTGLFLFRPHPDGGLYYMTTLSALAIDDLRPALVDATRKLMAGAEDAAPAAEQPTNSDAPTNRTDEGQADAALVEPTFVACELLSLAEAVGVAGDYLIAQPVANEKGSGCKYLSGATEPTIDPADFTDQFEESGLLLGVLTPEASQAMLGLFASHQEQTSEGQDPAALADLLALIESDDYAQAVASFTAFDWGAAMWTVEPLAEVDENTLLIYAAVPPTGVRFYLFHPRADGGLYYLTGVSSLDLDTMRLALVNAAQKLIAAEE